MRKLVLFTVTAFALACTGLAVAHGLDAKSVKAESASFTATTAGDVKTSTCTGSDGTYATSKGTYTGTVSGSTDASLNGAVTIEAQSLVNQATNLGTVTGQIRFGSGDHDGSVHFEGVYSGGTVVGIAEGRLPGSDTSLLANVSAGFSASGGFTNGAIGHGASGGDGIETTAGGCKPVPAPKPESVHANGAVSAVSSTSITAAGVTCVIPTDLQSKVAGLNLAVGNRVELECSVANGVSTLAKISAGEGEHSAVVKAVAKLAGHRK